MPIVRSELVDIFQHPSQSAHVVSKKRVVLGDLHANTVLLLWFLHKEGLVDIPAEYFPLFVDIYRTERNSLSKKDKEDFEELLTKIKPGLHRPRALLLGDDVADRGMNDIFTLLTYKLLDDLHIDLPVLASNHGFEFLKQYAQGINHPVLATGFKSENKEFGNSLYGLRNSIDKDFVSEEKVNELIEQHYLPRLRLLSYDLGHDNNSIKIYSHAPIHLGKIKFLADLLHVEFKANTTRGLAQTIDNINKEFQTILKDKNRLRELLNNQDFINFTWTRYSGLASELIASSGFTATPYHVTNVHGHVAKEKLLFHDSSYGSWSYVNLDKKLGSYRHDLVLRHNAGEITDENCIENSRGEYSILITSARKLRYVAKAKETSIKRLSLHFFSLLRPKAVEVDIEMQEINKKSML